MSRIDCARCGLPVTPGHAYDVPLCLTCHRVWIAAGRPWDELPPLSEIEKKRIKRLVNNFKSVTS